MHLQTNGVLLTDPIIEICADYQVGISISLDGPATLHDGYRVDHRGRPSHARVMRAVERLRNHPRGAPLFSGLLTVVDPRSDAGQVYRFLKDTGAPSLDFLYRDGHHDRLPFGKAAFETTEYGDWMCALLDVYLADRTPPRIRILDDFLRLILGGRGTKEGSGAASYGILVIDTDGTINKNDTLKSAHQSADQFAAKWSVLDDSLVELVNSDEFLGYHASQKASAETCLSCPELGVCGGGMTVHRWRDGSGFNNP